MSRYGRTLPRGHMKKIATQINGNCDQRRHAKKAVWRLLKSEALLKDKVYRLLTENNQLHVDLEMSNLDTSNLQDNVIPRLSKESHQLKSKLEMRNLQIALILLCFVYMVVLNNVN